MSIIFMNLRRHKEALNVECQNHSCENRTGKMKKKRLTEINLFQSKHISRRSKSYSPLDITATKV
jgi:hypothetical protein